MSRDRNLPRVPDGYFGVPDPDTGRMTLWQGVGGQLKDFPPGGDTRWRPMRPPYADGMTKRERDAARAAWYEDVYWPWRRKVAAEVLRDPATARSRFFQHVDDVPVGVDDSAAVLQPLRVPAPSHPHGDAARAAGRSGSAPSAGGRPATGARAAILQDLAMLDGPLRSLTDSAVRDDALVVLERIRAVLLDGSRWA